MFRSLPFRLSWSHLRAAGTLIFSLLCFSYFLPWKTWSRYGNVHQIPREGSDAHLAYPGTSAAVRPGPWQSTDYDYQSDNPENETLCWNNFGTDYLRAFTQKAAEYCNTESTASLTCFSNKIHQKVDSFCIGEPVMFKHAQKKFELGCTIRSWERGDFEKGLPQLHDFAPYWYNTGPHAIFTQHFDFGQFEEKQSLINEQPRGISLLVQREDNNQNMWHTMMEIMSLTMSLDVLRLAVNPSTKRHFFVDEDARQSQVVILDDLDDGPYYDLWSLMAGKPTARIEDLSPTAIVSTRVIVPLAGSSNPFWQGDWAEYGCDDSALLKTFSRRVLEYYAVEDSSSRSARPLRLTWIDRKAKRRLLNKEAYFAKLKAKYPKIEMEMVDYASLPLAAQVQISRSTDILVGVHGAGLTHGMFLPPYSAIVELQPRKLEHRGFELMARALGHRYFVRHSCEHEVEGTNGDWQHDDMYIDEEIFLALLGEAIASMKE